MTDWAEKNRAHFNEEASTYNKRFSKTILQVIDEIQDRRDWIGVDWLEESSEDGSEDGSKAKPSSAAHSTDVHEEKTVRLLDYACGTGLVSRALAPYVTQCIGIDLSENMVNEYNTGAMNQGIPEEEMHAVVGNLISANPGAAPLLQDEKYFGFDIAAVGLGWHHFDNPALAAKILAERLKKGGVLLIIDFLPHAGHGEHNHGHNHGHSHGHAHSGHDHYHGNGKDKGKNEEKPHTGEHTVIHFGFSEEDTRTMFENAGLGGGFEYVILGKGIVMTSGGEELRRSLFMAKGTKL
ncbi:S-adenosyl-L-methionine-dependent methyltransferase [Bisporella sp. PMI_857]|nr:S-adenosyl-L-methionine-dependent methyltransferase [Bisporella sp. PMI_857]